MIIINNYSSIFLLLLLLSQYARVQTGEPESKSDSGLPYEGYHYQPSILLIILNLVGVFVFMAIFCFLVRFCTCNTSVNNNIAAQRSGSGRRSRGLDPEVIEGFPILDYAAVKAAKIGKDALECAVCLTEFEDDDSLRFIPRCDHVFHPDCIDTWLVGHTTCPVCRCNLAEKNDNDVVLEQLLLNDVVVRVDIEVRQNNSNNNNNNDNDNDDCVNEENELMERPLHERMRRSRTMRSQSIGRSRWFGKLVRSLSTGHVEVKPLESTERFTLRLPEDVRKQIMNGKLQKRNSGKGLLNPSKGLFGSLRDRASRSGHWGFSLTPPFLTPTRSLRSHDGEGSRPTRSRASSWCGPSLELESESASASASASREISLCNDMKAELSQLPV